MESNNIVTAPQLADVAGVYARWSTSHQGDLGAFYRFMTTPSVERAAFVSQHRKGLATDFTGKVLAVTINPQ